MRMWASPDIPPVRALPINLYVEWPGYLAACGRISPISPRHIPRGSGIPQPKPIGQTHLPSHPIIIMFWVGVQLGLVGEVFWAPPLSPTFAASFVAYASPPRTPPSSGQCLTAGPHSLIGGSSFLLGMVVA